MLCKLVFPHLCTSARKGKADLWVWVCEWGYVRVKQWWWWWGAGMCQFTFCITPEACGWYYGLCAGASLPGCVGDDGQPVIGVKKDWENF